MLIYIYIYIYIIKNSDVNYVWFDFHHECRKMKYENLSRLINDIKKYVIEGGYFSATINLENVSNINILTK